MASKYPNHSRAFALAKKLSYMRHSRGVETSVDEILDTAIESVGYARPSTADVVAAWLLTEEQTLRAIDDDLKRREREAERRQRRGGK